MQQWTAKSKLELVETSWRSEGEALILGNDANGFELSINATKPVIVSKTRNSSVYFTNGHVTYENISVTKEEKN